MLKMWFDGTQRRVPVPPVTSTYPKGPPCKEWLVIHHTDCGPRGAPAKPGPVRAAWAGEFFTDDAIRGLLANSLETAALGPDGFTDVGEGPGSPEAAYIDWLTISDQQQAVVDDVARIRNHPLVPDDIPIYGYVYDVHNGRLVEVEAATRAGASPLSAVV